MASPIRECKCWWCSIHLRHWGDKFGATESQTFYHLATSKCAENCKSIKSLVAKTSRSVEEQQELDTKKHTHISCQCCQNLYLTGDAPGSTYFLQKVSHNVFGVIDHQQCITLWWEDQTKEYRPRHIMHTHLEAITGCHPWIKRVLIFHDNAANINKNWCLFSWGMEMNALRKLNYIHRFQTATITEMFSLLSWRCVIYMPNYYWRPSSNSMRPFVKSTLKSLVPESIMTSSLFALMTRPLSWKLGRAVAVVHLPSLL